jgi:hypothetical protein
LQGVHERIHGVHFSSGFSTPLCSARLPAAGRKRQVPKNMNIRFENEPKIFTTGAFLQPLRVKDSEGKDIWIWYVSEFIDDSFKDGEVYNPKETANTLVELIEQKSQGQLGSTK